MITVSPSTHDGTPNTLLEAIACGSFPVAGDIDSLREWINHGENGLLVDPGSPEELADAILEAIKNTEIRMRAQKKNAQLIAERAKYEVVMEKAISFYREVVKG